MKTFKEYLTEALAEYEEDRKWREENDIEPDPEDKLAKWIEKND
jgi:hypothetical protein